MVQTSKIKNLTIQLPIPYIAAPKSEEELDSPKNGTPDSKDSDSDSSFLKSLERTLKEGEADVKKGNKLFGKATNKRDRAKANEGSGKGGKLNFANKNDPIHILNELPKPTREALMAMTQAGGEACLLEYLDRHTAMLHNELNKATVFSQKTMYDKFSKLKAFMEIQGITFEPQTEFY